MIIGKGLIASAFENADREDVVFFASGVSNSLETDVHQFLREENLIRATIQQYPTQTFVYFSTCSIYDSSKHDSPYVLHKLHMEEIIKTSTANYLILRVSNAVGKGGNPNLLLNYLARSIQNNEVLNIHQKATRNLIDVDDVRKITLALLNNSAVHHKIYNLAFKTNYFIDEIVASFEQILGLQAQKNHLNAGESYSIDIQEIEDYFADISKSAYLDRLITKYYL